VGERVGFSVGPEVGSSEGAVLVGKCEGSREDASDGDCDGASLGIVDGAEVGS
jgi:hypothetical protein